MHVIVHTCFNIRSMNNVCDLRCQQHLHHNARTHCEAIYCNQISIHYIIFYCRASTYSTEHTRKGLDINPKFVKSSAFVGNTTGDRFSQDDEGWSYRVDSVTCRGYERVDLQVAPVVLDVGGWNSLSITPDYLLDAVLSSRRSDNNRRSWKQDENQSQSLCNPRGASA